MKMSKKFDINDERTWGTVGETVYVPKDGNVRMKLHEAFTKSGADPWFIKDGKVDLDLFFPECCKGDEDD